jgi:hypothetical protein
MVISRNRFALWPGGLALISSFRGAFVKKSGFRSNIFGETIVNFASMIIL